MPERTSITGGGLLSYSLSLFRDQSTNHGGGNTICDQNTGLFFSYITSCDNCPTSRFGDICSMSKTQQCIALAGLIVFPKL